ncbi:Ketosteroid isomerase homolog [Tangfeifania diversioriginum]|uniref:Ketosteroid isomerase homolog n=1 Tax=Tangfeifania diversioriginum TaxID=1168035 RepID=A0A1M6DKU4_9BACT|nr:nuclear transport factor 2 family protein [Tangfeifania diversioriginum]SHI73934.1 Ketosteroid isomerase homolog [Tangfeifania diversioriginum]
MDNDNLQIKKIITERVSAIKKRDVEKATAGYHTDVISYDVVGPLQLVGIDTLKKRLDEWLSTLSKIIDYEIADIEIRATGDLAYCSGLNHIDAVKPDGEKLDMWWRETTCYIKTNGNWQIIHAHSSVPFNAENGQASVGLKPE